MMESEIMIVPATHVILSIHSSGNLTLTWTMKTSGQEIL
jgi:hypothetical protein